MGCFPCCSPNQKSGSVGGNPVNNGNINQPGTITGQDEVPRPGTGGNMSTPGGIPPQHGIGRLGRF